MARLPIVDIDALKTPASRKAHKRGLLRFLKNIKTENISITSLTGRTPVNRHTETSKFSKANNPEINRIITALIPPGTSIDISATIDTQLSRVEDPFSDTCDWLLDRAEYKEWEGLSSNKLLFIRGVEGSGKSVLAKYLVRRLKKEFTDSHVVSFFCQVGEQNSPSSILRHVILQLCEEEQILKAATRLHRQLKVPDNDVDILWNLLLCILEDSKKDTYIIIDALDESIRHVETTNKLDQDNPINILLHRLCRTFGESKDQSSKEASSGRHVAFCIASRPLLQIGTALSGQSTVIDIDSADVQERASKVLESEIEKLLQEENLPEEIHSRAVRDLTTKLRWTQQSAFQWVKTVITRLETSNDSIDEKLNSIRPGIYAIYEDVLRGLRKHDELAVYARYFFGILTYAYEALSIRAISAALSINTVSGTTRRADAALESILQRILSYCRELISVDEHENLKFSHQSIIDFFLQLSPKDWPDFSFKDKSEGHKMMASLCIRYLGLWPYQNVPKKETEKANTYQFLELYDRSPFLEYAVKFWASHMHDYGEMTRELKHLCSWLFEEDTIPFQFLVLLDRRLLGEDKDQDPKYYPDPAFLLASKGLLHLVHPESVVAKDDRSITCLDFFVRLINPSRFSASRTNDDRQIKFVMDVNATDPSGLTLLHHVAQNGHFSTMRYLIENGARADLLFPNGDSIFWIAARKDRKEIVDWLLDRDLVSIEQYEINRPSSLHLAVHHNMEKAVEYLLEKKMIDPNVRFYDGEGWTPIIVAAEKCNDKIIKLLVKHGANLSAALNNGDTALYKAAKGDHTDACRFFFDSQPDLDPSPQLNNKYTPLFVAAQDGNLELVKLLISKGSKFICADVYGWHPMHVAAANGYLELVNYMAHYCPVDQESTSGSRPIHYAARNGHLNIVKSLIQKGADINAKSFRYWDRPEDSPWSTPLVDAVVADRSEVVDYLIENGAEVSSIRSSYGCSLIHLAAASTNVGLVRKLVEKYDESPFMADELGCMSIHEAASDGQVDVLKYFWGLPKPPSVNIDLKDSLGRSMLTRAAENMKRDMVEFLLQAGADPNLGDSGGRNPLISALVSPWKSSSKGVEILQLMLDYGAKIDLTDEQGWTPLHYAIERGANEGIHFLLDRGANMNLQDKAGVTPLFVAAVARNTIVTKLLLQKGADARLRNTFGVSTVDLCDDYPPLAKLTELQIFREGYKPLSKNDKTEKVLKDLKSRLEEPVYPERRTGQYPTLLDLEFLGHLSRGFLALGRRQDAKIALEYWVKTDIHNNPHILVICLNCADNEDGGIMRICAACSEPITICATCFKKLKDNKVFGLCAREQEHDWLLLVDDVWKNLPPGKVDPTRTFNEWMMDIRREFATINTDDEHQGPSTSDK